MSYGPSYSEMHRRAAYFVDRILKGTKPADLPVERPTKLELMINLKTAKQMGVNISPAVLPRANSVLSERKQCGTGNRSATGPVDVLRILGFVADVLLIL
jgi:hypothetical protein